MLRSLLAGALAVGALAAASAPDAVAASSELRPLEVGISDQKADMFTDERFTALGLRHARVILPWDVMSHRRARDSADRWLAAAETAGIIPLVTFGHSWRERRSLPKPERLQYEFRRFLERYPWVREFATWNEANHCGEPTCHRASLVAAYYRAMRRECPQCTILAADLLDMPNVTEWARDFRRALGFTPKVFGLHNYVEGNRFRSQRLRRLLRALPGAELWLTETGGLVRRRNRSTTDIPEGRRHAARVTRFIFDSLVPRNPQIKRVYLYHWNAGEPDATWDSGIITPGGNIRPSLYVLQRVLLRGIGPDRVPIRPLDLLRRPSG